MYNENMTPTKKRPYRKRKRAEAEEETRRRITEAAVELHGTVGPANTKVTDVAELAGVSRMTVYNHFPTDADLFAACSSHWASQNPFPDPELWRNVAEPGQRLSRALLELYEWYELKQGMLGNVLRDAPVIPALGGIMTGLWESYVTSVVEVLAEGWEGPSGPSELRAALRLAVAFQSWGILADAGLDAGEAARLATAMVGCIA
jgi:AcrR family transcriptional regulator